MTKENYIHIQCKNLYHDKYGTYLYYNETQRLVCQGLILLNISSTTSFLYYLVHGCFNKIINKALLKCDQRFEKC